MTGTGGQCCCWCGAAHPAGWRHASGAAAAYPPPRDQAGRRPETHAPGGGTLLTVFKPCADCGQEVLTIPEDTEPLCPGCEG